MVIIRIFGGLGNQMFQYALYHSMLSKGIDAYVDLSWYDDQNCHNGYELSNIFSVSPRIASLSDVKRLGENDKNILWRAWHKLVRRKGTFFCKYGKEAIRYYPEVFNLDEKYLSGYWQSELFFKEEEDEIRKIFSFSPLNEEENIKLADIMQSTESVSLHVRRGDYLNESLLNGICDEKYYEKAIKKIQEKASDPVFFIFSNDIAWCREHFQQDNVVFVENNIKGNSYRDMQLMSLCKHHIIANSSFSWWGAWLGKYKDSMICAPTKWMNAKVSSDVVCADWIKI